MTNMALFKTTPADLGKALAPSIKLMAADLIEEEVMKMVTPMVKEAIKKQLGFLTLEAMETVDGRTLITFRDGILAR